MDEIRSERGSACPNKFFKRTDPDSILSSQQLYAVSYTHESKTNPDGTPLKITSASPKTVKSVVAKVWGKIFSSAKSRSDLIFPGWDGMIFQRNRWNIHKSNSHKLIDPINIQALRAAIMAQSNKKQPGPNALPNELYKFLVNDPVFMKIYASLFNTCLSQGQIPDKW